MAYIVEIVRDGWVRGFGYRILRFGVGSEYFASKVDLTHLVGMNNENLFMLRELCA